MAALPPLGFADLKGVASSLLRLTVSLGLLALLVPALLLSLLLFGVLLSPILIASLIYLNGLEHFHVILSGSALESVILDLVALSRLEPSTDISEKTRRRALASPLRTLPITPRRSSFISDFEASPEAPTHKSSSHRPHAGVLEISKSTSRSLRKGVPEVVDGGSKGSVLGEKDGGRRVSLSSPHTEPFDFSETEFSPHWSAGKPTHWSPSPSPLDLSLSRPESPTLWPSPATDLEGGVGGSPTSTHANESFSPIRIETAVRQAMKDQISPSSPSKVRQPSGMAQFSTSLPKALRNVKEGVKLGVVNGVVDNSFSSEDDSLEILVPKLDIRAMTDIRKQALISEFRKVISELEATLEKREEAEYIKERLAVVPTPPPRPSAIPRNRVVGESLRPRLRELDGSQWNPNLKLVFPPPEHSPTKDKDRLSPAADGLYGAENVDLDYWKGFDQAYSVLDKSFESITDDDDLRVPQWRKKGKWIEKGVSVLGQLDEESLGSSSSLKVSTPSKKEVRWRDEERPTSPVAEIIPSPDIESPGSPISPTLPPSLSHTESVSLGHEKENYAATDKAKAEAENETKPRIYSLADPPLTPSRHQPLLLPKMSNKEFLSYSPAPSPSGSISGKLIKMYEELSKTELVRPLSRSADSSPTHSVGRLDTTAMEKVMMMQSVGFAMDGSVDGTATEEERKEEKDGVTADGSRRIDGGYDSAGLLECF